LEKKKVLTILRIEESTMRMEKTIPVGCEVIS
jgi:hypothetical protein